MEKKSVASLHDTRHAPAVAGMLINEAGQRELVEANVPPRVPCDSGRAGARGKGM
jgi:hypothetical protein